MLTNKKFTCRPHARCASCNQSQRIVGQHGSAGIEKAEIAKFNQDEYMQYEESLKYYRDLKNSLDTAREEGREKGREEGREEGLIEGEKRKQMEIAKKLKALGMTNEEIENITGLQRQDLDEL